MTTNLPSDDTMGPVNANEKLLRRFYEPLVLLSVLDPTRGAQRPDLIADRGLDEPSKLWRNFLDQLSWLCDSETGGDTVTSIAAQKSVDRPCFWVASNSTARQKAQRHLTWLFGCLKPLCTATSVSATQIEHEILTRCIAFGSKRVKAYTAWLLQAIEEARRVMGAEMVPDGECSGQSSRPVGRWLTSRTDTLLLSEVQSFENLAADPVQLCTFAYNARRRDFMSILTRRHHAHLSRGVWSDLRHYIGRLGCWTKAVRIVCQVARTFPQRIENAQIQVVRPYGPADRPNADHLTDLDGVVRRMVSAHQQELAQRLSQALRDVDSLANIDHRFRREYSSARPRPHAELLVLEHFHNNNFEFVADDRYIGCSKPSCYCCHIYMQLHKGGFAPRPCHGNLWIQWAPPIPLPLVDLTKTMALRLQDHHTFQMLQKMIPQIRQDLQEQILARRPKRAKMLDSTTGMSSVMFVVGVAEVVNSDRADDAFLQTSAVTDESTSRVLGSELGLQGQ